LRTEPDWHQLPAETPEGIRRLLRRSLQKDQKLRFRDMRDARLEIDEARRSTADHDAAIAVPAERPRRRGTWIAWMSALATVLVIAAALGAWVLRQSPLQPQLFLEINTPPTRDASVAISPDGLKVVFVARAEGPVSVVAALAGFPGRASAARDRARITPVLVAEQPFDRIPRGYQAEARRH
jgi:hypothetical protein